MNGRNDGLAELLVKLATDTATLIDRARASGAFKASPAANGRTVDGEAVVRPAADVAEKAPAADAQASALQDIIVQQAMRVHVLEGEVARLTGDVAAARAELAAARSAAQAARKKSTAKKPAAKTS